MQELGFSLESLGVLFRALRAGETLASVLGLPEPGTADGEAGVDTGADAAELYGFAELQPAATSAARGRGRPLLSVLPTTVWDESEAS